MKTKLSIIIALLAIITLALVGCGGNDTAPETFTVTFIANGGTPEPQAKTVEKGSKVDEPSITKTNSTLDGWYTEASFSTKWNFATDTVTASINLYAKWICNCPNGTLHLVGETCCDANCNCEKNVAGQRVEGIAVTNRDNVAVDAFNTMVTNFTTAFNHALISDTQRAWLKVNLKEVKIVPVGGNISISDGVLTVEIGTGAAGIRGTMLGWLGDNLIE